MLGSLLQTAVRAIYPPECLLCRAHVSSEFGLCATCWGDTPFVSGAVCDACGVPLPGPEEPDIYCDTCLIHPPAWARGRAALRYGDQARRLVLALKHGDRQDIARPAGQWMARIAKPLLREDTLLVPVPLHWVRRARRRYNQAALLAHAIALETGHSVCEDLLLRPQRTPKLQDKDNETRFATVQGAIQINPRRQHRIAAGRPVLLVDDVLTSGATFTACVAALDGSQVGEISVVALARAARGD